MTEEKGQDRNWVGLYFFTTILICLGSLWFGYTVATTLMKDGSRLTHTEIIYDLEDPYTEEKVKDYLKQLHVKYPKVALSQMKLESANGTSKIFKGNNNLFGMKLAVQRPTTALGERSNHAYYSHWRQSCVDYALYQAFVSNTENLSSEEAWLDFVGRVYAQDDSYKRKLQVIRKSLDK